MIVQLRLQKQVTRAALFEERGDIAGLGSDTSEFENDEPFGFNAWTLEFEAWDEALGRRKRRFRAKVSGGCDDFHLTPIAIRISGSASDGPRLRRLTCAYAAHGWDYEIGSL